MLNEKNENDQVKDSKLNSNDEDLIKKDYVFENKLDSNNAK